MQEHVKIQRLLDLLKLLSTNKSHSVSELAQKIQVDERTIYRYLSSFDKAGLFVEKKNGYYRLERKSPYQRELSQLLHFSEEEAEILYTAIESIEKDNTIKINLRDKLFALYDSDRISYPIIKQEDSQNVRLIIEAIEKKKLIRVINYKSSNSGKIKDRIVEPFDFTTNYIHIWVYEPEFQKNYLFRISRIERIEILNENWTCEKLHKKGITDVFRMSGETETPFKLKLTLKGYNYLIEQYPLAKKHIEKINDNEYIFAHWYANLQGITKFIFSAFDDIEVINPYELKDYLNNKIKNKIF